MKKFWKKTIEPSIKRGGKVIIVAHGNSLRSIVMHIEGLSKKEVLSLEIPTGTPRIYEFDGMQFFQS